MKCVFLSNYYNHHQMFFSNAMFDKIGEEYKFISTTKMREERRDLGYDLNTIPDYVLDFTDHIDISIIDEADVLICGSAPECLIRSRIKKGKLIFRYAERPLKNGNEIIKYIPRFIRWHKRNPSNRPIYLLCCSAYTSGDYAKFRIFNGRKYKWGYFPETLKYYDVNDLINKKNKAKILWCGRFLDWKHPDDVIEIGRRLKCDGYDFEIDFIGVGELKDYIEEMIVKYDLQDKVTLLGAMKPAQVRLHMERAGIYLFTSDFKEGWGAVLNEAMNSGCAVVANHAIGSVPFLMKHNENGLIYCNGDINDLYNKVKYLIDNPNEQVRIGKKAYYTIIDVWNSEVAAERFLNLVKEIKDHGYCDLYKDGPCSKAECINNNWFKGAWYDS